MLICKSPVLLSQMKSSHVTRRYPTVSLEKKAFRLQWAVSKHQLLTLVDSSSVSSFLNQDLVEKLQCTRKQMPPSTYVVANGAKMTCDQFVPHFEWTVQRHVFQ
jgi:hypothetical protein